MSSPRVALRVALARLVRRRTRRRRRRRVLQRVEFGHGGAQLLLELPEDGRRALRREAALHSLIALLALGVGLVAAHKHELAVPAALTVSRSPREQDQMDGAYRFARLHEGRPMYDDRALASSRAAVRASRSKRIASRSSSAAPAGSTFTATRSPVSKCTPTFTFPNVPSPIVFESR